MQERRQYIRIPESTEILYRRVPDTRSSGYLTKDISQSGIRFFIHEFIPVKSILKVRVRLKKNYYTFEALAKVQWIKEDITGNRFEIGVEFTEISTEAARCLVDYIQAFIS